MFSADLMVDDTIATANTLIDRLGLPALRSSWTDPGCELEELLYVRASHPLSAAAPTCIEVISPALATSRSKRYSGMGRQTPGRPVQTHATVFITKDYRGLIEHLRDEGIRHYDMPDPGDGLSRCWLGVASLDADDPETSAYDHDADGGTFVEVISWEGTTIAAREPIPVRVPEGGVTRVVARTYLVADADATLAALRRSLRWPGPEAEVTETDAGRAVVCRPAMTESAVFEVVQPTDPTTRHGAFFAQWGPGPHAIRLGAAGLEAKAADLHRRGVEFSESTTPAGEAVLVVEGPQLGGAVVELVEDGAFVGRDGR